MDRPFGGWQPRTLRRYAFDMLEIGLIVLSTVAFAILDRYVAGCERL